MNQENQQFNIQIHKTEAGYSIVTNEAVTIISHNTGETVFESKPVKSEGEIGYINGAGDIFGGVIDEKKIYIKPVVTERTWLDVVDNMEKGWDLPTKKELLYFAENLKEIAVLALDNPILTNEQAFAFDVYTVNPVTKEVNMHSKRIPASACFVKRQP